MPPKKLLTKRKLTEILEVEKSSQENSQDENYDMELIEEEKENNSINESMLSELRSISDFSHQIDNRRLNKQQEENFKKSYIRCQDILVSQYLNKED